MNRWFLDPLLRGSYPVDMRELYERRFGPLDAVGRRSRDDRAAARLPRGELLAVEQAMAAGVDVRGYHVWSSNVDRLHFFDATTERAIT